MIRYYPISQLKQNLSAESYFLFYLKRGQLPVVKASSHLRRAHELGALSDALLNVAAFLIGDGRMLGGALVRREYPEHVPDNAETPCVLQTGLYVTTLGGLKMNHRG